jgi:hypothetical protein
MADLGHRAVARGGRLPHQQVVGVGHQRSAGGYEIDEAAKRLVVLHLGGEDVGVVVLDVGENDDFRTVEQELGALVEEGGVVFVPLHDEVLAAAEPVVGFEVEGDPAGHEGRVSPRLFEEPGEQRRYGGLAVSAGDEGHPLPLEEGFPHEIRHGGVVEPAIEHRLHLGIAPGEGVAHDDEIRRRLEVPGAVPLADVEALLFDEVAGGREDSAVGTGDGEARLGRHGSRGGHAHPSDADEVNMLRFLKHHASRSVVYECFSAIFQVILRPPAESVKTGEPHSQDRRG